MSTSKCIKPHATNTSDTTLRIIVLVLALAALLFPVAARADLIELTSGGATQGPVGNNFFLAVFGDQFALTANLIQQSNPGTFPPSDFFVGRTILVHVGFCCNDAPGSVTYQGHTRRLGDNFPSLVGSFDSEPFVVPPLTGPAVATVPFTVTASILSVPPEDPFPLALPLRGTGLMTFTFLLPFTSPTLGPVWVSSRADFVIMTPEPSTWLLVPTGVGLAWLAHRKRKANREHGLQGRMESSE